MTECHGLRRLQMRKARHHRFKILLSLVCECQLQRLQTGIEPIDHAAIAEACGLHGVRIERPDDYLPALEAAFAADRATVIDVITDPDAYPPITAFESRGAGR